MNTYKWFQYGYEVAMSSYFLLFVSFVLLTASLFDSHANTSKMKQKELVYVIGIKVLMAAPYKFAAFVLLIIDALLVISLVICCMLIKIHSYIIV